MKKSELLDLFKIEDILDLPGTINQLINSDLDVRNSVYERLLALNNFDLSHDWFQAIFEEEIAQRRQSKQDFTPRSIGLLASLLTGIPEGHIFEPTAGNGSMIISDWWVRCRSKFPWEYFPSRNMVTCWELSDRSIPILLLNLSIRGIMGYVFHGDVLTQKVKMKYILLNKHNDGLGFSEIIKDPNNEFYIIEENENKGHS